MNRLKISVLLVLALIPVLAQESPTALPFNQTQIPYQTLSTWSPMSIAWSPDGEALAIGGREGTMGFIILYDVVNNTHLRLDVPGMPINVSFSPNSTRLAIRYDDEFNTRLLIWDRLNSDSPSITSQEIIGASDTNEVRWSPSGHYIAANASVWIYVIDALNGQIIAQLWDESLTGNTGVLDMAWTQDERHLTVLYGGLERNQLLHWDIRSVQVSRVIWSEANAYPMAMSQSLDYQLWALSLGEGSILIFDTTTDEIKNRISISPGISNIQYISHLLWTKDRKLYGLTADGAVYLWDTEHENLIAAERLISGEFLFLRDIDASPYRGRLAMVIDSHSRDASTVTNQQDEVILLDGLARIIIPAPSLDRLNAIAELCVRDAPTPTRAVTGLTSQRVTSLDALPDFVAQVESLPEGAIPAACRADLLAVAEALR